MSISPQTGDRSTVQRSSFFSAMTFTWLTGYAFAKIALMGAASSSRSVQ